jgi:hypothetical protein
VGGDGNNMALAAGIGLAGGDSVGQNEAEARSGTGSTRSEKIKSIIAYSK